MQALQPKNDSLTLWELEAELVSAYRDLENLQESEATSDEILDALSIVETYVLESVAKRDRCGSFLQHLEDTEINIEREIDRLKAKHQKLAKTREQMKAYILAVMERCGLTELKGKLFTFKSKNNPPAVEITSELALPPQFMFEPEPPPPKPDKTAIREALKRGEEVPGAKLVQKKRLEIS